MAKHGKKYLNALKAAPKKPVSIEEAVKFVKAHPAAKFDETLDVSMRLGADTKKTDTPVRGVVKLPAGSGKKVKVLVFAGGEHADEAKAAGADYVGLDDLIEKITKDGWTDFDVAIATTEAMKSVRKCARVLGPRGLMPNPKTGTVTDDPATAVKDAKAGKVDFRMDQDGQLLRHRRQALVRRRQARRQREGRRRGRQRRTSRRDQGYVHPLPHGFLHDGCGHPLRPRRSRVKEI